MKSLINYKNSFSILSRNLVPTFLRGETGVKIGHRGKEGMERGGRGKREGEQKEVGGWRKVGKYITNPAWSPIKAVEGEREQGTNLACYGLQP
jgi:hypothetical protein